MAKFTAPQGGASHTCSGRSASRDRERERDERRPFPIMATECEERLADWLVVTDPATWGSANPFNLVDGGKEGLTKKLCDVTSDVKKFPADGAPYGSYLVGRLAASADIPATDIPHLGVYVEIDKSSAHLNHL